MSETTIDYKKDFRFSKHWQTICSAYNNISFSPEKRADTIVKDYSIELDEDLKELGDNTGNYAEKYERYLLDWIHAKGRCISWMITGPARFPVAKAEKANQSEHNKYEAFRHWRQKYFKAVNRVHTKSPEEDLEIKLRQVDEAVILNERIKEHNKVVRKFKAGKITKEQLYETLTEQGMDNNIKTHLDQFVDERWFTGFSTIAPEIKRLKDMATAFRVRIERKSTWEDIHFDDGTYKGRITIEDDRVKIFHDEKPDRARLDALSGRGFKYSRNWNCHCRKHTGNAVWAAKQLVGVK